MKGRHEVKTMKNTRIIEVFGRQAIVVIGEIGEEEKASWVDDLEEGKLGLL